MQSTLIQFVSQSGVWVLFGKMWINVYAGIHLFLACEYFCESDPIDDFFPGSLCYHSSEMTFWPSEACQSMCRCMMEMTQIPATHPAEHSVNPDVFAESLLESYGMLIVVDHIPPR